MTYRNPPVFAKLLCLSLQSNGENCFKIKSWLGFFNTMETLNRYQAADIILEYIDRAEHHSNMFDAKSIQKELFPNVDIDTIQFLFEFIYDFPINPPVANLESRTWIYRSVHTKHFLDDGGFTKVHNESISKSDKQTEKENLEIQQLKTNNMLLTNQLADYEKTKENLKKTTTATIVLSAIALIELILLLKAAKLF